MCWENIHNTIPKRGDSNVDSRCYQLKNYEKDSLKQISEISQKNYEGSKELLKDHLDYLFNLTQRLKGILEMERSVGAPTAELEMELESIKKLFLLLEEIKRKEG